MKFTSLAFLLFLSTSTILAQNDFERNGIDTNYTIPVGLKVGEKAPRFKADDYLGNKVDSKKVLKENTIILIFYRGEWCPYCDRYLSRVNDSLAMLIGNGARVIAVGPETVTNVEKTQSKSHATFTLISDSDEKIMTNYDVLFRVNENYQNKFKTKMNKDLAELNGKDLAKLPVAATYIIGQDGVIKYVDFNYNYRVRPSVESLLEALKK